MACINKNLKEFKDLALSFPNERIAYALAMMWQKTNKDDRIPTYQEIKEMQSQQKKKGKKKKTVLKNKLLTNLQSLGLVNNINGKYYLNVTSKDSFTSVNNKITKIKNFLAWNDIPSEFLEIDTKNTIKEIKVNDKAISNVSSLLDRKQFNTSKTRKILDYLLPKLPGLKYQMVSVSDAKVLYDAIPKELKQDVDFNHVKSFFNPVNREVVIIDSRVTDDIAIEEILHPFVAALNLENSELFNNLLEEAKKNEPELHNKLKSYYDEEEVAEELVTQAMVKYFKKEYEKPPSKPFVGYIKKVLNWFYGKIQDIFSKVTGNVLAVKAISKDSTFSDIAKLLNTDDLIFEYNLPEKMRVKYSLSDNKERIIDNAIYKAETNKFDEQKNAIIALFKNVRGTTKEYDQFTVSHQEDTFGERIIILEEEEHVYQNKLNEQEEFVSVTGTYDTFKGNEENFEYNRDMGNIFDSILEAHILGIKKEGLYNSLLANKSTPLELLGKTKEEQEAEIKNIQTGLSSAIASVTSQDDILLPQVIVHNMAKDTKNYKNIAGAIDLLVVTPEGKLKIIDLKTSRDSIKNKEKYDKSWPIDGTLLHEASKKSGRRVQNGLSKRQKHTLQLAVYSAILQNMGFEMDHEQPYFTINFKIQTTGERKTQEYAKEFIPEGKSAEYTKIEGTELNQYPSSLQEVLASYLVENRKKVTPKAEYLEPETTEPEFQETIVSQDMMEGRLTRYRDILLKRKEAIEQMRNKIFMSNFNKPASQIQKIDAVMSLISNALDSNSVREMNEVFTDILRTAVSETDKFIKYLTDPLNQVDSEFIVFVQNAELFAKQFQDIHLLRDSDIVNPTIDKLIKRLQGLLNTLVENDGTNLSVAQEALFAFVRTQVELHTSQEFTKKEMDIIMSENKDISLQEYWLRDLATSRDVHLRVMNKIMHNTQMRILDDIQARENIIRSASRKLILLSGNLTPEEIYDFMLYEDGTYIRKHSKEFTKLRKEKRMNLFDENGNWKKYIEIKDEKDFSQEQIDHNLELYEAKQEYAKFMRAEEVGPDGTITSGMYYKYRSQFIKDREKYENLRISEGGYAYWEQKVGISERVWNTYEKKYYGRRDFRTVVKADGIPTAETVEKQNVRYVLNKWKKIKDEDSKGKSLLDDKYVKLQKPTNELEQAQLEFYNMFIEQFEEGLLRKLPPGERNKMLGRIPVRRNKFATSALRKPSAVILIWTRLLETLKSLKEFFTSTTTLRAVKTNEFGDLVDSVPIFFTGSLKDEELLQEIDDKIEALKKKRQNKEISHDEFKEQNKKLVGKRKMVESRPNQNELSRDLGTSLLHFSRMAENYEKMSEAENVFHAFMSVIEKKTIQPSGSIIQGFYEGKDFEEKGQKLGKDSNIYKRAQAFMNMIVYEKDKVPKGKFDVLVNKLMKYTSLSYVSLNPFGSYNNYLYGKLSNYNEAWGGRFFSAKSYHWAELEYKSKGIKGWIERMSSIDGNKKTIYDPKNPLNKFEALVDFYRMEDKKGDLREASFDTGENTWAEWLTNKAYGLQDLGEHINQTKIGMSIVKDFIIQDIEGKMPEISLYDAYVFDPSKAGDLSTRGLKLKEGYESSKIIKAPGQFKFDSSEITPDIRYNIRSYIRETNKQIHGNYADKDRMVIQANSVGKLFAQFHRWVAPAFHARFQEEYYDENLGWMEGRFRSAARIFGHLGRNFMNMELSYTKFKEDYIKDQNIKRPENISDEKWLKIKKQREQKFENRLKGFNRTMVELVMIVLIMSTKGFLEMLMDDDDDELDGLYAQSQTMAMHGALAHTGYYEKKMFNWARWQLDRTEKDFMIYMPIFPKNITQLIQMIESPIASTRTMGELTEALSYTISYPLGWATLNDEDFLSNKDYYYQRGPMKGRSKLSKNWGDAVPLWYTWNKWMGFDVKKDYYIGK
jgi:transcription termination factor NusB